MNRLAPLLVLVLVTGLFLAYGRFGWSPLAGPLAAAVVWLLARNAREPAEPAPGRREPAPVD